MTERCFNGRKPIDGKPNYRLIEHDDQHRGTGLSFIKRALPTSVVNDHRIFEALEKQRLAEDRSNEVIYHESGMPVTIGITFDTGMRVWVPPNFRTDKTLDLRVPFTPLSVLTKHSGARLEEARVAESQTSTDTSKLILTVFSTGLPLLLAVWWVAKHVSDTMVHHSEQCRELPTHEAVKRVSGWSVQERVLLTMKGFGVTILVAPFALALAEGKLDPRISVEVTTGATVFYGSTYPALSEDLKNPIAGAPYFVTVWMSVRNLGSGFAAALAGSLLFIFFLAILICMRASKKSSEMMPGSRSRWRMFSFWKLYGSLRLFAMSVQHGEEKTYKVLLEFYDDHIDEIGVADVEDGRKEVLLTQTQEMRALTSKRYFRRKCRKQDQQVKRLARESLHEALQIYGRCKYRMVCKVRMNNQLRYEAAMCQSTVFDGHLPREWEYVRRSVGCFKGIDWYRTNGVMPPDEGLIFVRLGLLSYMKYVKKAVIVEDHGPDTGESDEDGVKSTLIVTPVEDGYEITTTGFRDSPEAVVIDHRDNVPSILTKKMSSSLIEVTWKPETFNQALKYGGGTLHIRYVLMDEKEANALTSSNSASTV